MIIHKLEASIQLKHSYALLTPESRVKIWYQLNAFGCFQTVDLVLLIRCLLLLPLFVEVLCLVLVLVCSA